MISRLARSARFLANVMQRAARFRQAVPQALHRAGRNSRHQEKRESENAENCSSQVAVSLIRCPPIGFDEHEQSRTVRYQARTRLRSDQTDSAPGAAWL